MPEHYSQIPPKPLVAGISTSKKVINQVFFFERSDGQVICVEEGEAWNLYTRRQQVLGRNKRLDFKLIGTGNGDVFRLALFEAQKVGQTDIAKAQEIIRQGQKDELEACRGRIIAPRDMDKLTG